MFSPPDKPASYLIAMKLTVALLVATEFMVGMLAVMLLLILDPNDPKFSPFTKTVYSPFPKIPRGTVVLKGCSTEMHA